jgi:hypothetical protein
MLPEVYLYRLVISGRILDTSHLLGGRNSANPASSWLGLISSLCCLHPMEQKEVGERPPLGVGGTHGDLLLLRVQCEGDGGFPRRNYPRTAGSLLFLVHIGMVYTKCGLVKTNLAPCDNAN